MLFNSWVFILLLAGVFILHHLPWPFARRELIQVGLLTAASFVFYGYHLPSLCLLLAGSLVVNGLAARALLGPSLSAGRRRWVLFGALVANLGALGFFKYAHLLASTVLPVGWLAPVEPFLRGIPLPVGISFYTFQGLSLVIDAYWGRQEGLEALRTDLTVAGRWRFHRKVWMFISFFPQLVAGPIIQAHQFVNQIRPKRLQDVDWTVALRLLITGYFLKMVVADNLKEVTTAIAYPFFLKLGKFDLIGLLYAYSFQIFADFCGYSLIAMGVGRLFGYRFPINFNFPYLAQSITEFWRRWHISLSSWLRDYLYIPLGGNRRGRARTYLNLFLVMFLGGLWHGAAWSYAVWGTAHGVFLALERLGRSRAAAGWPALPAWCRTRATVVLSRTVRVIVVFSVVSWLWLLFKLPEFHHAVLYLQALRDAPWRVEPRLFFGMVVFGLPVVLYHLWGGCTAWRAAKRATTTWCLWLEQALLAVLLFLIIVNSGTPGAFIYFQF
ncbi:MBOAT family protein [bacterium]|nr:MBOAT family protein [bacterium]